MICGIILSGGESRRMKSPKALLKIGQSTFVESIIQNMDLPAIDRVIVITGPHHREIGEQLKSAPKVQVIRNEKFELGQFSSLRKAIESLPADCHAVIVWPVDLPLVKKSTVQRMVEEFRTKLNPITIPVFQGRKGHPVIYNEEAMKKVRSLNDDHTAKELQMFFANGTNYFETDDEGILIDIDTPEEYETRINLQGES